MSERRTGYTKLRRRLKREEKAVQSLAMFLYDAAMLQNFQTIEACAEFAELLHTVADAIKSDYGTAG